MNFRQKVRNMGALVSIISIGYNYIRPSTLNESEPLEDNWNSRNILEEHRRIKQTEIIKELKLLESCTDCYLKKKAESLIYPFLEARFPWDDEDTDLISILQNREVSEDLQSDLQDRDEDEVQSCDHSSNHKDQHPPPSLVNTMFNNKYNIMAQRKARMNLFLSTINYEVNYEDIYNITSSASPNGSTRSCTCNLTSDEGNESESSEIFPLE